MIEFISDCPETFVATINTIQVVPTQMVISPDNMTMTIDPGELEYGRQYEVIVSSDVLDEAGDPLGQITLSNSR